MFRPLLKFYFEHGFAFTFITWLGFIIYFVKTFKKNTPRHRGIILKTIEVYTICLVILYFCYF